MKIQEVILRAMGKKITWWQAAEIIGISDRTMRRWRTRWRGGKGCSQPPRMVSDSPSNPFRSSPCVWRARKTVGSGQEAVRKQKAVSRKQKAANGWQA
ncbi:MAG: helix-turn-helix domain-containing protein [Terriglobia bacterium]